MTHQEKLSAARALVARIPQEFDPAPVPEVAKALGVSGAAVRAWIANGHVRAIDIGTGAATTPDKKHIPTWRVDRASLIEFLAGRMK